MRFPIHDPALKNADARSALSMLTANVQDKIDNLKTVMSNLAEGSRVPDARDMPGIYCSTGKASCQDLNPDQPCICYTCAVWKEYNLGHGTPSIYFCQNGKAT